VTAAFQLLKAFIRARPQWAMLSQELDIICLDGSSGGFLVRQWRGGTRSVSKFPALNTFPILLFIQICCRWGEEEVDISPEDEAAMAAFLNPMAKQRTLADIILEKIQEKQQRQKLTLGEQGG